MWIIALMIVAIAGLLIAGKKMGWGPFSRLHPWDREVKQISKKFPPKDNQKGIIFYGASNFAMWYEMENDLSAYKVQNHGFGGCTDKDLNDFAWRLLYPYDPSIVFFQTGSNDYVLLDGTDEEKVSVCMAFKRKMFAKLHERMPNAKFVIMSGLLLPSRSQYTHLTLRINEELQKLCSEEEYLYFIDAEKMTYDGQNYAMELFLEDGIHLNHPGQLKWMNEYIEPMIVNLIDTYGFGHVRKNG